MDAGANGLMGTWTCSAASATTVFFKKKARARWRTRPRKIWRRAGSLTAEVDSDYFELRGCAEQLLVAHQERGEPAPHLDLTKRASCGATAAARSYGTGQAAAEPTRVDSRP